jgi:hypothetical protein
MAKTKRKPETTSNPDPGPHALPLWHLALIIVALGITTIGFALTRGDTLLRTMCLATGAFLIWHWLRASGRL